MRNILGWVHGYFFMGFYFDYEELWWVFEIFRVAFLKKVKIN